MTLLRQFQHTIREMNVLHRGDAVIIGVSGGADSLVLLHLFAQSREALGITPHIVHVHHGIRGAEADADAEYVAQSGAEWGVSCHIEWADAPALAQKKKLSLEDAARRLRYEAFNQEINRVGCDSRVAAVAHNADDQAETVLMHLLRGAGLAGLRGILPIMSFDDQYMLIRPLLNTPRVEIEAYCAENHITPRQDSTNLDLTLFRNRIRHEVMPYLNELSPGLRDRLVQSASLLSADHEIVLMRVLQGWDETITEDTQQRVRFGRTEWLRQPLAVQRGLIRWAFKRLHGSLLDLSFEHVEAGIQLVKKGETGTQVSLPDGLLIRLDYNDIVIELENAAVSFPDRPLLPTDTDIAVMRPQVHYILPNTRWRFTWMDYLTAREGAAWEALMADPFTGLLSKDILDDTGQLSLRTRQAGDSFHPQGVGGTQKISDFMSKAKIPKLWRDHIPLLVVGGEIAWVCGWRVDQRFIVRPETKQVIIAQFEKDSGASILRAPLK